MDRNLALDILKLSMAFMVVGLHSNFLNEFDRLVSFLLVNGLFRIAVPLFLIINGFYFYQVIEKKKVSNWFKRVFLLYFVWMLLYSFFWFTTPEFSLNWFVAILHKIIFGYHHLWYVSGMIGAAIILIVLKKLPVYFLFSSVLVAFVVGVLIQYFGNYNFFDSAVLDKLANYHWFHRNMVLFSFPFLCIGYLINKHKVHEFISEKTLTFCIIFGLISLFLESYINYINNSKEGIDNLFSLIFLCPFIFILFVRLKFGAENKSIALYSSAIYFVHVFFLSYFSQFELLTPTILTFVVLASSIFAAYFIIKLDKKLNCLL